MFHATLLMIPTCFIHIICYFYAFSGTNLLTRCHSASSCFLLFLISEKLVYKYSRNWTKQKPTALFSTECSRRSKKSRRRPAGGPPHRAARLGPLPRPGVGRPPPGSPDAAPSPIYS